MPIPSRRGLITPLWLLLAVALVACSRAPSEGDFRTRFDRLPATDDQAIERLLDESRSAEAGNPYYYIATANHFFKRATSAVVVSTKPPEPGDLGLTDPKTGQVAGSISQGFDPEMTARGVAALREGIRRFPERLDMRFGLAHLLHETGDFAGQRAVLDDAAAFAVDHGERLRWRDGGPLPTPAAQFVPQTLAEYAHDEFEEDTAEGDERFLALAQLTIRHYPRHPYAYNAMAAYWHAKQDLAKAVGFLQQAYDLDPSDPLVVYNLGLMCAERGDPVHARQHLEAVIASANADDDLKAEAKTRLDALATAGGAERH